MPNGSWSSYEPTTVQSGVYVPSIEGAATGFAPQFGMGYPSTMSNLGVNWRYIYNAGFRAGYQVGFQNGYRVGIRQCYGTFGAGAGVGVGGSFPIDTYTGYTMY